MILFLITSLRSHNKNDLNISRKQHFFPSIQRMKKYCKYTFNLPFYKKIANFFLLNTSKKMNLIKSNIHFSKLKRVSYSLYIFCFFTLLKTTICMATDESDDAISSDEFFKRRLTSFEYSRDKAFKNIDYSEIQKLTKEIAKLIAKREDISQKDSSLYINSIVKTQHIFPGKILYSSYNLKKEDFKSCIPTPETLSLIILSEVIADQSLTDSSFFALMEVFLNQGQADTLKEMILCKINDDIENKILTAKLLKNIKDLLSDTPLIRQICEIELSYSPLINFFTLYNELMPTPFYRGYEVHTGIHQYNYWPLEKNMQQIINLCAEDEQEIIEFYEKNIHEKRTIIQKILSENEYAGQFKALSLTAMEINPDAVKDFGVLAGLSGSFIPYLSNCFPGDQSQAILLVRNVKSSTPYNHEEYLRIKDLYKKNQINYSIKNIENPNEGIYRHFAEQGASDAQFKYAEILLNRDFTNEFSIAFSYLKQASLKENSNIQYHLATMYEARIRNINESEEAYKKAKEMAREAYEISAVNKDKRAQYILSEIYKKSHDSNYKKMAERFFNLATDNGNAETQYELAIQFECGLCNEINKMNEVHSENLFYLSAMQKHPHAAYILACIKHYNYKDESEAVKLYHISAENGYPEAQYILALMYQTGLGFEQKNEVEAMQWYEQAANQGCSDAMYALAIMNLNGTEKNFGKAGKYLEESANLGNARAQYYFGLMNERGIGITENIATAYNYFKLSANLGNAQAQYKLAAMYEYGIGISEDVNKAIKWYRKAACQGFFGSKQHNEVLSQTRSVAYSYDKKWEGVFDQENDIDVPLIIGFMYKEGCGIQQDIKKAAEHFQASAENNNDIALYNLAYIYEYGLGVKKDIDKATEVYLVLARRANAAAQYKLYQIFGQNIDHTNEAKRWHYAALKQGYFGEQESCEQIQENKSIINQAINFNLNRERLSGNKRKFNNIPAA